MGADHAATASVFLVAAPSDRGPTDNVRMLQARGLVLLGLRRVTTARAATGPAPSQPGTDRPTLSGKEH